MTWVFEFSDINFAIFVPYPGSELFEDLKKRKKVEVNDVYFNKLHAQFDFTKGDSYCENVPSIILMILRFMAFLLSYASIYIARPMRIFKLLKNIFSGKEFFATNLLEQRIYEFFLRKKMKRKEKKISASA